MTKRIHERYNCVTKLDTVMKKNFLLSALVLLFVALFALPANAQRPGGTRGSTTTTPSASRTETKPSATRTRTTNTARTTSSRPQATTRRTNPTPTTSTRRPTGTSTNTNRQADPNYCPPGGTTATNRRRTSTQTTGATRRANQGFGRATTRPAGSNDNVRTRTVPASNRSAINTRDTSREEICVCPTNRKGKVKKHKSTCEHSEAGGFDDVYGSRSKRN